MLFLKKEESVNLEEIKKETTLLEELKKEQAPPKKRVEENENKKITKQEPPKIDLTYYNLSLEKDYKQEYHQTHKKKFKHDIPPLTKIIIEPLNNIDFNVTPELNYNKLTKELTIDGVQIQLEKKF
ncbi:MAG: hypothetical protein WC141_07055 [Arcobacteraceae bacterium]